MYNKARQAKEIDCKIKLRKQINYKCCKLTINARV